jgi:hypothetical protein
MLFLGQVLSAQVLGKRCRVEEVGECELQQYMPFCAINFSNRRRQSTSHQWHTISVHACSFFCKLSFSQLVPYADAIRVLTHEVTTGRESAPAPKARQAIATTAAAKLAT